jgi:hypothetical protein
VNRSQVHAAVRAAVGFHQWSGQPPTMARIVERRSHHVGARWAGPPSSSRRAGIGDVAGVASAGIVIGLSLVGSSRGGG